MDAVTKVDGWVDAVVAAGDSGGSGDDDWEMRSYGVGASVYGGPEEDEARRRLDAVEEPVVEISAGVAEQVGCYLGDVAARAQRMESATFRRLYVRGRAHQDFSVTLEPAVRQRLFLVTGYIQMTGLNDPTLYERIKSGRVITRLGAPTAMGKTTALPAEIAKRCGKRVCLVTLDSNDAKNALERMMKNYGLRGSDRTWVREPGAYIYCTSYHDFRGIVCSGGRKRFFLNFDVFVFDEPQVKRAVVWAAKQFFAVFADEHHSLILLSATASTEASNDMVAKNVGRFIEEPVSGGFDALLASGELVTKYCHDRTMVVVSHEMRAYQVQAFYTEAGCDVKVLDTGSSRGDEEAARRWLSPGEAVVPRILVTTQAYGTGKNFPVSYLITSADALVYVPRPDGTMEEMVVPLEPSEVQQHCGRTGRGMAVGSGGIIASKKRAKVEGELMACERLEAHLSLVAGGVIPMGVLGDLGVLLPSAVSRETAKLVLSFNLPPLYVLRCLGSDGRVAARLAPGLAPFIQRDCVVKPSRDVDPVGYASWVPEPIGGYMPGDTERGTVVAMVPFSSPPSLRVIMHTVYCISQGWLEIPTWRPEFSDDTDSDTEDLRGKKVRNPGPRVSLRLVVDEPVRKPATVTSQSSGWVYDGDAAASPGRKRRATAWGATPEGSAVIREIVRRAEAREEFSVPGFDVNHVGEGDEKTVELRRPTSVVMESPGGSAVFSVSGPLYVALLRARALEPGLFADLLGLAKKMKTKFVLSTLFDCWGNPWLAFLRSAADNTCMDYIIGLGLGTTLARVVERLYERFRIEAIDVATKSNLHKSKLRTLWSGRISLSKLARAVETGSMPVAQSDTFLARFRALYVAWEYAVACMESHGIFKPSLVTDLQEQLPLRAAGSGMPKVGEALLSQSGLSGHSGWNTR